MSNYPDGFKMKDLDDWWGDAEEEDMEETEEPNDGLREAYLKMTAAKEAFYNHKKIDGLSDNGKMAFEIEEHRLNRALIEAETAFRQAMDSRKKED